MEHGIRYVGLDVHRDTISLAVLDSHGQLVQEKVIETKASAVLAWLRELRGPLHVVWEEGTSAAWLYELLEPRAAKVLVCDPRKNRKRGNKSDRIDARKLAHLLRCGELSPVFHQDAGVRTLKELARSYLTLGKDLTRVMNRIKAVYRSWAIPCAGKSCYGAQREAWLARLPHEGVRRRAQRLYQQLDALLPLRQAARKELLAEGHKHPARRWLRQIPYIGPIRAVLLIALIQTPHRFRSKRQLWAYCGLALETHSSGDYRSVQGQLQRSKKAPLVRGLNDNHHHDLKYVFKSAATMASGGTGPLHDFYQAQLDQGVRPEMARLTLARKIAAIVLVLWKKGVAFDPQQLKRQAA
jgi:transposase